MRVDVVMPQLGESVVEGVVAKWLVKAGDAVAKDQPLVEISTDKVDAEIPSPAAGVVVEILAKEGETVPIQAVIARIDTEKEAAKPAEPPPLKAPWDEETEGFPGAMARRTEPPLPSPPRAEPPKAPPAPPPSEGPKVRISPVVARMAAEHGLDLSRIPGTGIDGRVTKKDVEDFLAQRGAPAPAAPQAAKAPAAPAPPPAPPVPEGDQVIPFTPIRKRIAEHMVMSKRTSAHVHTVAEVDLRKVAALRAKAKETGVSMTYLPFVLWAAVAALREYPYLNASVAGESTVLKKSIHMGIAVDTDRGLIVPVIRDADRKSLSELSKAVEDIAARASAHRILPDELSGGTFTVTNPGPKGNLFGTAIINQPQVGILRMGQVVKRAVVVDAGGEDAIVIRPMMYLCLGYDHRIVDGVAANGFLFRVREILETGTFSP
ncbi:MAG: 2-oxo acid dehydrogenase subunit E2 [Deltaproteobacteria bacterium]|nr:2-oxo acid dehydrogenase subunit E2 [Deltaproteobacteria bacterium]PWB61832.1 MAG: 2-oxoglutarate dehydrogenase, E2 component, dihydrolipoamide succinyltransferase [Deltaproteobacteria bacterium]